VASKKKGKVKGGKAKGPTPPKKAIPSTPPPKRPAKKPAAKKPVAKPKKPAKPAKTKVPKSVKKHGVPAKPAKKQPLAKPKRVAKRHASKGRPERLIAKHGFSGIAEIISTEVEKQFRDALEQLKSKLGGNVYVFVNRQFHVDAQWLYHVPRSADVIRLVLEIEEVLRKVRLRHARKEQGGGTWLVSGFRFPESKSVVAKNYDRWKRLLQVIAWPRRYENRHLNFASLRGYLKTIGRKRYRKPEMVFVKLHWNVNDIKPTREEVV